MKPTKKLPLFVITGASCAGKSTTCELLFKEEADYIVMESDLIWNNIYNTPEDGYAAYRELWLRVCANIAQIGKPVVLCGCAVPEQFEGTEERSLFSGIHYIAVVCSNEELLQRMKTGRGVTDENWIKSSVDFNQWLITNGGSITPKIVLLDTTEKTPQQAAKELHSLIVERINNEG